MPITVEKEEQKVIAEDFKLQLFTTVLLKIKQKAEATTMQTLKIMKLPQTLLKNFSIILS